MLTRQSKYAKVDGAEIHYSEWGSHHKDVVLCVPGFSRNGRDFDLLAAVLAEWRRVICIDLPGRGLSSWASKPDLEYSHQRYELQIHSFLEALEIREVSWLGTSYGGSAGIFAAGGSLLQSSVTRLILNDVGPELPGPEGRARIAGFLLNPPAFPSMTELEAYYRGVYEPFGITTDQQWKAFTELSCRRRDDGLVCPDYDPRTAQVAAEEPTDLWARWDSLKIPVLIVHGASSDVLSTANIAKMQERVSDSSVFTVPECGHAPALNTPQQIEAVIDFLVRAD